MTALISWRKQQIRSFFQLFWHWFVKIFRQSCRKWFSQMSSVWKALSLRLTQLQSSAPPPSFFSSSLCDCKQHCWGQCAVLEAVFWGCRAEQLLLLWRRLYAVLSTEPSALAVLSEPLVLSSLLCLLWLAAPVLLAALQLLLSTTANSFRKKTQNLV